MPPLIAEFAAEFLSTENPPKKVRLRIRCQILFTKNLPEKYQYSNNKVKSTLQ